jgi:hypothetical protein
VAGGALNVQAPTKRFVGNLALFGRNRADLLHGGTGDLSVQFLPWARLSTLIMCTGGLGTSAVIEEAIRFAKSLSISI